MATTSVGQGQEQDHGKATADRDIIIIAELRGERDAALAQKAALAEVLEAINAAPADPKPVFDLILQKAHAICGADMGALSVFDAPSFRPVATLNYPERLVADLNRVLPDTASGTPIPRMQAGAAFVHIPDADADDVVPASRMAIIREQTDLRTLLFVALRKGERFLGFITAHRSGVRPYAENEIALLRSFADQAVIAIENARLITEQREALERQTATAEVLGVINANPGDLAPVFDVVLQKAHDLCGVAVGSLNLYDGGTVRAVATHGWPEDCAAMLRRAYQATSAGPHLPLMNGERFVQREDMQEGASGNPVGLAIAATGARTSLHIPLRSDTAVLGSISAFRMEVRPFSDKEISLLENFAAQAVIAMENARLITEQRKALEQQTATADVLQIINANPGDATPVFDAILDSAHKICGASIGALAIYDGKLFRIVAAHGFPAEMDEILHQPFGPNNLSQRLIAGERLIQIPDVRADEAAARTHLTQKFIALTNVRTRLVIPLRKEGQLLGYITVNRTEVRPFSEKEISLLENFASQAVIAMENARLITEQREALERQTATAEVLQAINANPGDLAPVFDAMLDKASRLCESNFGILFTYDGTHFHTAAMQGVAPTLAKVIAMPMSPREGGAFARFANGANILHVIDIMETDFYQSSTMRQAFADNGGARTVLWVALRKEATLLGVFVIFRQHVSPFSANQVALVQSFAAQAVIAMENARLITEQREALERQMAIAEVLHVISTCAGDLQPVFDAIRERAFRLCDTQIGGIMLAGDNRFSATALAGLPPAYLEYCRASPDYGTGSVARRLRAGEVVHVDDMRTDEGYRAGQLSTRALVELGGARSFLGVPLQKNNEVFGAITIYRQEVRPFNARQADLLREFAAQAMIAIENTRLITEQREALEQQTAMADVLGVINANPGNLAPVFDAILEKGLRLAEADFGTLWVDEGDSIRAVASHRLPAALADFHAQNPVLPKPPMVRRMDSARRSVQAPDIREGEGYRSGNLVSRSNADLGGARTILAVLLVRETETVGLIQIFRQEVRPFTDKQIALLENFAAQAVIAMENARLITEQREALEQQTAMAELLQVINTNSGDLAPVFDTVLEKTMHLCGAAFGEIQISDDGASNRVVALRGVPEAYARGRKGIVLHGSPGTFGERILAGADIVNISDLKDEDAYRTGQPPRRALVDIGGARSAVAVALRKERTLRGTIIIYRQEVKPFDDHQITLLQNFAAQAMIAMENARLLGELQDRTAALAARNSEFGERIEQQSATIDVLKTMSASPGDPQPVFDLIAERARQFCQMDTLQIVSLDGGMMHLRAITGLVLAVEAEFRAQYPRPPDVTSIAGRAIISGKFIEVEDLRNDPIHSARALVSRINILSSAGVPMLRAGKPIGSIAAGRSQTGKLSSVQVELLQTFAEQAVIAITSAENHRALGARTEELTRSVSELQALEETIRAVNSSLDLDTVLSTIINRAVQLSQADEGTIYEYDEGEEVFVPKAAFGMSVARVEALRKRRIRMGETHLGRSAALRAPVQVSDVQQDTSMPGVADFLEGIHAVLAVPLLRDQKVIGGLVIRRREAGDFAPSTATLLQTFAGQSVLAIENARLFEQLSAREEETSRARVAAEAALTDLRRAQDRLVQSEKMASLGQLTAGIAHEIKNPLNFVNNFSDLSVDLLDELNEILAPVEQGIDAKLRAEIKELTATLQSNLRKITEHGRRADSIVKNMLAHSRTGASERRTVDLNATADDALNLAYHGARAEFPGFNVTLEKDFDPSAGVLDIYPQEFTRVLVNLVNNGLYATRKRAEAGEPSYEPTLRISTHAENDQVEITVRDNGTGIPVSVRDKIFEPFFTTKPTGEGTGLGLSLSYDIIVKQHGGQLTVASEPGNFTEFRMVIPRKAPQSAAQVGGKQ